MVELSFSDDGRTIFGSISQLFVRRSTVDRLKAIAKFIKIVSYSHVVVVSYLIGTQIFRFLRSGSLYVEEALDQAAILARKFLSKSDYVLQRIFAGHSVLNNRVEFNLG